ncbi:hypothetical protein HN499_05885 [archaeon]|jgi:uncharacterized protein (DUF488 family)|nr:hypothetical protein [archaeon]
MIDVYKLQRCIERLDQVISFLDDEDLRYIGDVARQCLSEEAMEQEEHLFNWTKFKGNAYAYELGTLYGAPVLENGTVDSEVFNEITAIGEEELSFVNKSFEIDLKMEDFPGR